MPNDTEVFDAMQAVEKSHRNLNSFQKKLEGNLLAGFGEMFAFVGKVYRLARLIYERQNALEAKFAELERNNLQ